MEFVVEIVHDLLTFTEIMGGGLVVSLIVASLLPADNPLKQLLNALCARIGVTLAMGAIAMPIEFIPGIDALYDLGTMVFLAYYWFTFFRDAIRLGRMSFDFPPSASAPVTRALAVPRPAPVSRVIDMPETVDGEVIPQRLPEAAPSGRH